RGSSLSITSISLWSKVCWVSIFGLWFLGSDFRQHASEDFKSKILFIAQTIGPTLEHTDPVVETLHKTQRHFIPRLAVSRDAVPMPLDHAGKFLVGFQTLPFERLLPVLKKAPSPSLALVAP